MRYFTPGPSQINPAVHQAITKAFELGIPSISHRSSAFMDIVAHTNQQLRDLLNIPEYFSIWYFSSANEIWERLVQNCVREHSYHLVNGDFSSKFYDFALQYGKKSVQYNVPPGESFHFKDIQVPDEAELIAAIANETSTGVQVSPYLIYALREKYMEKLLVVDVVSAYPTYNLDLSLVDGAYFSVQKGFGLPAGLGVLIAGPRLLSRAQELEAEGRVTGSYHSFTSVDKYAKKLQTPETPNVLGIYLLGKVAESMMGKGGYEAIVREHEEKKAALWEFFDDFEGIRHAVPKSRRSETVLVLDCDRDSSFWIKGLWERGFEVGAGYGDRKGSQLRIANFPSMEMADVEALLEAIGELAKG